MPTKTYNSQLIAMGNLLIASLLLIGLVFSCSDSDSKRVPHSSGGTIEHSGGGYQEDTYEP